MPAILGLNPLPEAFRGHGPLLRKLSINQLNPPPENWGHMTVSTRCGIREAEVAFQPLAQALRMFRQPPSGALAPGAFFGLRLRSQMA